MQKHLFIIKPWSTVTLDSTTLYFTVVIKQTIAYDIVGIKQIPLSSPDSGHNAGHGISHIAHRA